MVETIHSFLEESAKLYPYKKAIIFDNESITYSKLENVSSKIANYFSDKCKKGERIGILLDNSIEFVLIYIGILKAGCIAAIFPTNISDENLLFEIIDCTPSFLIYEDKLDSKINRINLVKYIKLIKKSDKFYFSEMPFDCKVNSSDISTIIYTSGTTGRPKGVKLQHENVVQATKNINLFIKNTHEDILLSGLPLSHSFGLGHLHVSLMVGGTIIIERNFINLKKISENININNVTIFAATPTTLGTIAKEHLNHFKKNSSTLKKIITNTGPIEKNLVNLIIDNFPNIDFYYYYGLTEASRSSFINFNKEIDGIGSVGKPSPNTFIEIRDGEICISGKHVIKEYWNNTKESEKIKNGWLYTGDSGYFDVKGYLHITGRIDDIINVNGEKVSPLEVEEVVKKMNICEDVVAVGAKDKVLGEVVNLYVVAPKAEIFEILNSLKGKLESYKIPKQIFVIESIPRTDSGKVKRGELKND